MSEKRSACWILCPDQSSQLLQLLTSLVEGNSFISNLLEDQGDTTTDPEIHRVTQSLSVRALLTAISESSEDLLSAVNELLLREVPRG
jgi:hypothetical protein